MTKTQKAILLMIIIVTLFFLVTYKNSSTPISIERNDTNNSIFTFENLNKETFNIITAENKFIIDKMNNKIVLLKIFGWDCPYCLKEIPQLIKLQKEFDGLLEIIAIESQKSSLEQNKHFTEEYGINYHIVSGNGKEAFYKYLKKHYSWEGIIPLTIVLNEKGEVLAFEMGIKSYSLAKILKNSLAKNGTK